MAIEMGPISALAALPAAASPAATIREGFVAVPLQTSGVGHFHFQASLNGVPIEVLLDTGAASTVIDKAVADEMKLNLTPLGARGGGAGAGALAIWSVADASLEVGAVHLQGTQILAMDFLNIRAALAAKGVSAPKMILGADVLRSRAAVIDYGNNTLFLQAE